MILENKKLIIFDLDGTLIDSGPDLALSLNLMLKKMAKDTFDESTIHEWVGNGALTLVKRALSGSVEVSESLDEKVVQEALEIFLQLYKENVCVKTKLYPNVKNTLRKLFNDGYTLAIVTNKPYGFVPQILETLEVDEYFKLILGGDSLKDKKPSPIPLLHVCQELGFKVDETIMVGDSKNDILAAKAANMQSIAVTYGYNYGEDVSKYAPNAVVEKFEKIVSV
ncbi:MAG: phosphoglycolate phosphatase [Campylobacterales bacterium]|nr:phosphoglycolate phosphatase [Campylobacterales bacterium]